MSRTAALSRAGLGAAALAACFLVASCAKETPDGSAAPETDLPPAPTGTASIRGVVRFAGTPPKREPVLNGSADPSCHQANGGQVPLQEKVVVNGNGTLRNVIVFVKEGLPKGSYAATSTSAVLNQKGCVYEPHVLALQTGQKLEILNSDDTVHNVNARGTENKGFNFSMINSKVPPRVQSFERAEYPPFKIKCDIHPWMLAWAAVFSHPYSDVTGLDGSFEITGLPAGEYVIETWQEEYGTRQQVVTVGDGEQKELELKYEADGQG